MNFLESVEAQIKILKHEEAIVLKEMAPLQNKLELMRLQIAHLDGYLTTLGSGVLGGATTEKEPITEKIVRVFERSKSPLHYMEVMDLLETQEGFVLGGKDPKANMTAKLAGSAKFKRLERGVYILSEWAEKEESPASEEPAGDSND